MIHGIDCPIFKHKNYLEYYHKEEYSGSFDVGGVEFCGRCHAELPRENSSVTSSGEPFDPRGVIDLSTLERITQKLKSLNRYGPDTPGYRFILDADGSWMIYNEREQRRFMMGLDVGSVYEYLSKSTCKKAH